MMKCRLFDSPDDLCVFVNTVAGLANFIIAYYDTASGKHVVLYKG